MPTPAPAVLTFTALIRNFAEREAKSLYKRSILGWLWSLIKPLTTVLVYSLVFGVIYRTTPPETANGRAEEFSLYLFSGIVIWNLFAAVITGSMQWLKNVSDLRKKIYFPTETAILGGAVSTFLQSTLEALVLVVVMAGFGNISWTVVYLPLALVLTAMVALGIGFTVSILNIRYRDIEHLMGIFLNVAFFLVPIVFVPSQVPEEAYGLPIRRLIDLNPLSAIIGVARDGVYFLKPATPAHLLITVAWSSATFTAGLVYFRRRSMQISEEP